MKHVIEALRVKVLDGVWKILLTYYMASETI